MNEKPTLLLNSIEIAQKIKRMAWQIYEHNVDVPVILLAGIMKEGYIIAQSIAQELQVIGSKEVIVAYIKIDKTAKTIPSIETNIPFDKLEDNTLILVDDVLNTGKTLCFALQPFLSYATRRLQVAVLVDRNYPLYPIRADYIGYALSTTIEEQVETILTEQEKVGVYLK